MSDFEKELHAMFDNIWDCEIDHPLFQDTVGELMEAVIQAHEKHNFTHGTNLAEVGTDLVSRQQTKDAIDKYLVGRNLATDGTFMARLINEIVIDRLPSAEPTFDARDTQYNLPIGTDYISRQQAIDDIWTVSPLARLDRKWVDRWLRQLPSAQPEIIRCRECKFASGDSRICMKFDHSPIGELDFCSFAERREVTT